VRKAEADTLHRKARENEETLRYLQERLEESKRLHEEVAKGAK
jgi:hypothetical protein